MAKTKLHNYSVQEKLNKMDVDLITVVPTCEASAIDQHDVLFDFTEIPNAVSVEGGSSLLQSIMVLDKDHQGGQIDLVFCNAPAATANLGALDDVVDLTDEEADALLGFEVIGTYMDGVAWELSNKKNIGLVLQAAEDSTSIYVGGIIREASKDYSADGLTLKFGIIKD